MAGFRLTLPRRTDMMNMDLYAALCFGVGQTRAKKCEIQEEWLYERK